MWCIFFLTINCFFSFNSHLTENKVDAQQLLRPQCVSHSENYNSGNLFKRGVAQNTLHSLGSSVIIPWKYFAHRPYYNFPHFNRNNTFPIYHFQKLSGFSNHDFTLYDVSTFAPQSFEISLSWYCLDSKFTYVYAKVSNGINLKFSFTKTEWSESASRPERDRHQPERSMLRNFSQT
jgi:hypothetical protein